MLSKLGKPVLNISCGKTDYGDVNADIAHCDLPGFVLYERNKPLPFADKQFGSVFSTHTLEHVDDVEFFLKELHRVGDKCYIIYPLISPVAFNPDHKWIFLDRSTKHYFHNPFYRPYIANYPNNPIVKHYWEKSIKPLIEAKKREQAAQLNAEFS